MLEYTERTVAADRKFKLRSLKKGAALDKTQPEAQIPANPANHRTNSIVTGRRRLAGNQQSGQAVTFPRDSRFHRRCMWRPQLAYSIRTIRLAKR
jgi:hypothetical protein